MSTSPPNAVDTAYAAAASAFQAGRLDEATRILAPFIQRNFPDARMFGLAGFVRMKAGDASGAADALAKARSLDGGQVVYVLAFGDAMEALGRRRDAQEAYRAVLAREPSRPAALVGLANSLMAEGREDEAVGLLRNRVAAGDRDHLLLATLAEFHGQMGDAERALDIWKLAAATYPNSGVARHNLAAAFGDRSRYAEAEAAARAAIAAGVNGPPTWLVLARALQGLGRLNEAEAAFRETVRLAPNSAEAHRDLTQILWMRTSNVSAAGEVLREALRDFPDVAELSIILAKLYQFGANDLKAARAVLDAAIRRGVQDASLFLVAGDLALADADPQSALLLAQKGALLAPDAHRTLVSLCDAYLGVGDARRAAEIGEILVGRDPDDQIAIARLATAYRLLDDPRYRALFNYDDYVRPYQIETPQGWPDLAAYLADLSKALVAAHGFATHPFDQSLRNGSQTSQNLQHSDDPAIKAFFKAIDAPIRRHMEHLQSHSGGMGRRYLGDYSLSGVWSVFLRPNGFHVDHIHPAGWLSSAFYVETPVEASDDPMAGWIKFGEPGNPTQPRLGPEHAVKPQPGTLVLFPSYMWHGTVPFSSDERRLTIAFDVRPVAPKPTV